MNGCGPHWLIPLIVAVVAGQVCIFMFRSSWKIFDASDSLGKEHRLAANAAAVSGCVLFLAALLCGLAAIAGLIVAIA